MTVKPNPPVGRAKGGIARREKLTKEQLSAIARKGGLAKSAKGKVPIAIRRGNFKEDFGFDVECYVLDDESKTAVISQRGMGVALGLGEGGSRFPNFIKGKVISSYLGQELLQKLEKPLIFQAPASGTNTPQQPAVPAHGYDVTNLIDVCHAVIAAHRDGKLRADQENFARQAHVVISASAKAGIKGLVYALTGYDATREQVIQAFRAYVQEEAKKYEQEFPPELYAQWHRLYEIPVLERGRSWHFKHLTVRHIYYPLAKSNGKILELMRALKASGGDRKKKLFQFLNELGARALRMQIGRVLEMTESSAAKAQYEARIVERFGGQQELDFEDTIAPSAFSLPSEQSLPASQG